MTVDSSVTKRARFEVCLCIGLEESSREVAGLLNYNEKKLVLPCMTSWKPVLFAHFLNAELLGTIAPYMNW